MVLNPNYIEIWLQIFWGNSWLGANGVKLNDLNPKNVYFFLSLTLICYILQTQIQYLKQVQQPSVAQLRSSMVDPAINLFFLKMKAELEQTKDKLEQAQNELSAWKFTPDR